ncbi:glycosyltransferase [Arundinibacter roseus]|uniref:Glycosyltransferase n=1 Tax=Arundinibacter roseus TaxID=2070510 RepID=A0A4V2X9N2_9BACT|nr:glycosyltransferase [Arundinibacter roseus]TDB64495.1 glycosyltransferase [Arundinibacter roseus]
MKILNICAYTWAIGGPARIIYDHTAEALKNGHEVTILSPMSPGDKMYEAPEGAKLVPCRRTTPISSIYREFSLDLYKYLKNHMHEYDLIHIHGIWHFGSLAPFLIRHNLPIVITIHGLLDQWAVRHSKWKKDLVTFLYQKKILAKADVIHVNNTDEVNDVVRYLGFKPKNLVIIPNGMKFDEFWQMPEQGTFRARFSLPTQQKMILFMGRLNIKKGLDLLLPAFAAYHKAHPDSFLVLAGPDDGYLAETQKFIVENALEQSIHLVGMLTGSLKKAALGDADLFVLPSYSEGFSIAVMEAMAARVPALVSDRVGFGEYIQKYDAAYLTPLTVQGVTEGLFTVLQNEALRLSYPPKAYAMLKENFEISVVAKTMLTAYESAMTGKS